MLRETHHSALFQAPALCLGAIHIVHTDALLRCSEVCTAHRPRFVPRASLYQVATEAEEVVAVQVLLMLEVLVQVVMYQLVHLLH